MFDSGNDIFLNAFQFAGVGMALVGLDGSWLRINPALCAIVGYTEEELVKLTFQDITYPEDLDLDLANLARLRAGEVDSYQMEKRYVTKSGEVVWILLIASMVRNRAGEPQFYVSQIKDINARKKAEQERDALLQLPMFLHGVINFDGFAQRINPVWIKTFHHARETWLTQPFLSFVHPDDYDAGWNHVQRLAAGEETPPVKLRMRCADQTFRHTIWSSHSAPALGVFYTSGFDTTASAEAEENLRTALREKELLVAELQRSNSEITSLRSKLLTICAWTKQVRSGDRWVTVDEFLVNELGLHVTHGMSAEAERQFMSDAEDNPTPPE